MANQEHLDILRQGVEIWNTWRKEHPEIEPDLNEADLGGADLYEADLHKADLSKACLSCAGLTQANLSRANLSGADCRGTVFTHADLSDANLRNTNLSAEIDEYTFRSSNLFDANLSCADLRQANFFGAILAQASLRSANLTEADLRETNLSEADLSRADLFSANLSSADLRGAKLSGAKLYRSNLSEANLYGASLYQADLHAALLSGTTLCGATLVETNLTQATLTNCPVYGIAAWKVQLQGAIQENLIITPSNEPTITVDNLKVAQFIYLLLDNQEIREIIDTITSKVVLILGRFTPKRKAILDALRDALRHYDFLPVVFDFDKPSSRNLTETVSTLAHISRFIIADLTNAKSITQELERIVPRLRVPVQPILHISEKKPYGMFESFEDYPWVLPLYHYPKKSILMGSLRENIIDPAEQKARELEKR